LGEREGQFWPAPKQPGEPMLFFPRGEGGVGEERERGNFRLRTAEKKFRRFLEGNIRAEKKEKYDSPSSFLREGRVAPIVSPKNQNWGKRRNPTPTTINTGIGQRGGGGTRKGHHRQVKRRGGENESGRGGEERRVVPSCEGIKKGAGCNRTAMCHLEWGEESC